MAVFGLATLDGGAKGMGIPVLVDLFERLSDHYDICFYSLINHNAEAPSSSIKVKQPTSMRIPGRLKYFQVMMKCFFDHLRQPWDLIFAISPYPAGAYAVLLGKWIRRPVVVQMIAYEAASLPGLGCMDLTIPWLAKITRRVCRETDHLVTVAHIQKEIAKQCLPTQRDIDVLPLRINSERFPFVNKVVSFPVHFIHIAYYSLLKDQDTMFRAFARIASEIACTLTVIGRGYNIPKVHALLQSLKISDKVRFVEFATQSELPGYFAKAHILFHPARFETGCAVIQEAMASGVVVCGTSVGILADLGQGFAVAVNPEDDNELARQTLQLIADKERYAYLQQRAYQWITTYGAAWSANNYLQFLNSIQRK
jgi:glycosyltransferase involved in cell wall biosynthesis